MTSEPTPLRPVEETEPEERTPPTIGQNFVEVATLIAEAKRQTKLNESTLVKLWELTLLWAVNNSPSSTPMFDPSIIATTETIPDDE